MAKITAEGGLYLSTDGGTTYKLAVCLTSYEFNRKVDTIDTSSFCDDGTASFEAGRLSWTVSFDGLAEGAPSGTQMSFNQLDDALKAKTIFTMKIADDPTTPVLIDYRGSALLTSLTESFNNGEVVKLSGELTGRGTYTSIT